MEQQPNAPATRKVNAVGVQFQPAGQVHNYDAGQLPLRAGDQVVVEAEHGHLLGTVIVPDQPAVTPAPGTATSSAAIAPGGRIAASGTSST